VIGMNRALVLLQVAVIGPALLVAAQAWSADAVRGKELYEARCGACHSIEDNRVGPAHKGVVGRKAGTAADYDYSPAVKASTIVWSVDTLDRWLTDPERTIPGQKVSYSVPLERDRSDIIAYLVKVSAHP
jgi:cytochrome c